MAEKPVLARKEIGYRPVTEDELDAAVEYAKKDRPAPKPKKGQRQKMPYKGQELDRNLLRILGNSALERRTPGVFLAMLAANVVRDAVPQYKETLIPDEARYEGYKCAVMKIMNIRRVWQMRNDKKRREQGLPIPERPKQTHNPEDPSPKNKGQVRLTS